MRLVQILDDFGIEELYEFPDEVTNEEIKNLYTEWQESYIDEYESFEEYLEEFAPQIDATRKFVDEIYV